MENNNEKMRKLEEAAVAYKSFHDDLCNLFIELKHIAWQIQDLAYSNRNEDRDTSKLVDLQEKLTDKLYKFDELTVDLRDKYSDNEIIVNASPSFSQLTVFETRFIGDDKNMTSRMENNK